MSQHMSTCREMRWRMDWHGRHVFKPTVVTACCTKFIIRVRVHGRLEGGVGIRVRGHQGTLVILGYGTHGQR